MNDDDDCVDIWDNIASWVAYGIGALMALVFFGILAGHIWAKIS